jgi:hypothetical protein
LPRLVLHRSPSALAWSEQKQICRAYVRRLKKTNIFDLEHDVHDYAIAAALDAHTHPTQFVDQQIFEAALLAAGFKLWRVGDRTLINIKRQPTRIRRFHKLAYVRA